MNIAEIVFFYLTVTFYLLSIIFRLFIRVEKNVMNAPSASIPGLLSNWCMYAGFLSHIFTFILRWDFSGHFPIMGTYETTLSGTMVTSAFIILFSRRYPEVMSIFIAGLVLVIFLMIYALLFPTHYIPLTISEQGAWVKIHGVFAWLSFGSYVIASGGAAGILLPGEETNKKLLDEIIFYAFCSGFFFQTLMMATGSYYSFILFGKWWRWDPIESISLVCWLLSALVIHTRLFYNWREKRFAVLVCVAFIFIIFFYKVFPFLPKSATFHNFDITF